MRPAAALSTAQARHVVDQVSRLDPPRDQIVGYRHMDAGPLSAGGEDRDRIPVLFAEGVHHQPDLVSIGERGFLDRDRDISNLEFRPAGGALTTSSPNHLFHLPGETAVLLQERLDPMRQVFRRGPQRLGRDIQPLIQLANHPVRTRTGDGFDSPHARRHTGLRRELKQRDLPGAADMGAAAQLERNFRHVHDPHLIPVFLAE